MMFTYTLAVLVLGIGVGIQGFVFACIIWPRPLRHWLWPRDGHFIHGVIYRKGEEPEHV